jgi:eukaryotic-like serine/threonine-protein kinase
MVHSQTIGKYEIIRKLSRSMTDVYLAIDTETNGTVVLKIIEHSRDDFTQLVMEAERRGAQLQKQLHATDARILEIYDFGEQNGCFFVAMEYFAGSTLAEMLGKERRLEPKRAARYAAEICSQLRTLHSFISDVNGHRTAVVHGDIKPSNIQIGANDELRLLDFGIAKVITFTHNLTHHNLGSPSYCSPERLSKAQVDQHADLWALGVSLYEMVAGAPPYQAQTTRKLENLIQSRRPPRALPPNCPPGLKAVISKALAGELERRYASAEAFENDLRAFLDDRPTAAEQERVRAWDANATIEKHAEPRPEPRASAPTRALAATSTRPPGKRRKNISSVAIALLAGVLVGLLSFIPISYYRRFENASAPLRGARDYAHEGRQSIASDWNLYQNLKGQFEFLGDRTPVTSLNAPLHANLISSAGTILDAFRHSSDERLSDFDFATARLCLRHALEIDPADTLAKGELALCDGYLALGDNPDAEAADRTAAHFREAESYLPRSPDPHLGLARAYIYGLHNIGQALAEFHQAEQLGYRLGPREQEQEADGFLYRAESELAHARRTPAPGNAERNRWLQAARGDLEHARSLYEQLTGFSNVDSDLEHVYAASDEETKLQAENVRLVTTRKRRTTKRYASVRRWQ